MLRFFTGPSSLSLAIKLALAIAFRYGWHVINGGYFAPDWYEAGSLVPLPHVYPWNAPKVFGIVDYVLIGIEASLLIGLIGSAFMRILHRRALRRGHVPKPPAPTSPLAASLSWFATSLGLSLLVLFTCTLVGFGFHIAGLRQPDLMYVEYLGMKPVIPFAVAAVIILFALVRGQVFVAAADTVLNTQFRVVTVPEGHPFHQRVARLAAQLGLPAPAVGITDVYNAFAMGSSPEKAVIVIGRPILKLPADQLDAIIGHELGHVLHRDVRRMQFAEGFQQAVATLINWATVVLAVLVALSGREKGDRNVKQSYDLAMFAGNVSRRTVLIGSEMLVKGISRSREFVADAVGARLTSNDAMIRALQAVHQAAEAPSAEERKYAYLMFRPARLSVLFSTHPGLSARIRALGGTSSQEPEKPKTILSPAPAARAATAPIKTEHPSRPAVSATENPASGRKGKRPLWVPLTVSFLVISLLALATVTWLGDQRARAAAQSLQQRIDQLGAENEDMRSRIRSLQSDSNILQTTRAELADRERDIRDLMQALDIARAQQASPEVDSLRARVAELEATNLQQSRTISDWAQGRTQMQQQLFLLQQQIDVHNLQQPVPVAKKPKSMLQMLFEKP